MARRIKLNLQLFADGDTNQNESTEVSNEQDTGFASIIRSAMGLKAKETEKKDKEPEKKDTDIEKTDNSTAATDNKDTDVQQTNEPNDGEKDNETKEPEYDEIVYNKEKVKIPVAERQTYLQKGYNYDKVKTVADNANAALLRAAKLEGFKTVDEYLAELDKRDKAKLADEIYEAAGDPDKIDEIVKNHPEVVRTREERQMLEFEKKRDELKKDRFFKELEPEFDELMAKNPTAEPGLVYSVLLGDYVRSGKINDFIAKEKESVEKKVLADVHDKERRTAPRGGDTSEGSEVVQPSEFGKRLAGLFGVSASKVAQRSHEKLKRS